MTNPDTYETLRISPPGLGAPTHRITQRVGVLGSAAALVLVVGGAVTQWQLAVTAVPSDLWRFPWSPTGFLVTTLIWATTQTAVVPALLVWQRSGAAGDGVAARWGHRLVIVGTVIGVLAHLASLPFVDRTFDEMMALGAAFGLGALLATVGFLMTGVSTVRAGHWTGLFRWTPLCIGVAGVTLMFLQFTPLLPSGVGLYYLGFIPLGVAIARVGHNPARPRSA